jgi:hypothetical protein
LFDAAIGQILSFLASPALTALRLYVDDYFANNQPQPTLRADEQVIVRAIESYLVSTRSHLTSGSLLHQSWPAGLAGCSGEPPG